jgi:hypothetical protein
MTATAVTTRSEIDLRPGAPSSPVKNAGKVTYYTLLAIFDGTRWSAICRELDIASDGDNAFEALIAVRNAVNEAIAVAAEQGIAAGKRVSDADLAEFLSHHVGPDAVSGQIFVVA